MTAEQTSQQIRETISTPTPRRVAPSNLLTDPIASTNLPELEALGRSLREAREAKGLSVEALAGRLNMGFEQLQALEEGNRERLREPVFVIAQARRVAGALGVTVDAPIEALRRNPSFNTKPIHPAPSQQIQHQRPASQAGATPSTSVLLKPLLLGLAVAAGVVGAAIGLKSTPMQLSLPKLPAITPSSPATPAVPAAPVPQATASAAGTLKLSARGRSWLEVTSPQGQSLFRGTFEGEKTFPLGSGLRVLAGRPDLVSVQVGDGPSRVLGPIAQVQWRRFTPEATAPAP